MASEAIYKSGQGYWTRMVSASAAGLLLAQGTFWMWSKVGAGAVGTTKYVAAALALVFLGAVGSGIFWALGRNPRTVDFLIATEGEMKKVNWSTRREIIGSTSAVIMTVLVISVFCYGIDRAFFWFFAQIKVLDV